VGAASGSPIGIDDQERLALFERRRHGCEYLKVERARYPTPAQIDLLHHAEKEEHRGRGMRHPTIACSLSGQPSVYSQRKPGDDPQVDQKLDAPASPDGAGSPAMARHIWPQNEKMKATSTSPYRSMMAPSTMSSRCSGLPIGCDVIWVLLVATLIA